MDFIVKLFGIVVATVLSIYFVQQFGIAVGWWG